MIRLERYPRAASSSVADVTRDLISVAWSDALEPPWQSMTLRMRGPSATAPPFDIGDHLALRLAPNIPAAAWAIVVDLSTSLSKSGPGIPDQAIWNVHAVGWFDYLGRVDLVTYFGITDGPEGGEPVGGTVFSSRESPFDEYLYDENGATLDTADSQAELVEAVLKLSWGAGVSLDQFMRIAPRIGLPAGLAPAVTTNGVTNLSQLRDSVRVAHNGTSAAVLCGPGALDRKGTPARAVEPIIGLLPNPQPLANGSAKLLGFVQGTWGVDPGLAEMFPTLEDPPPDGGSGDQYITPARQTEQLLSGTFAPAPIRVSSLLPGAAQTLGRNPVLVYRMRPWRVVSLLSWVERIIRLDPRFGSLGALALPILRLPEYATFQIVTWDLSRAAVVTADDLVSMDVRFSDDDATNVITAQQMGALSPTAFATNLGLPIVSDLVSVLGARVYTASFPFMRGADAVGGPVLASIQQAIAILAAQAAQWHLGDERFARGSMRLRFRGDIRIGEPIILALAYGQFVAYVESIDRSIEIAEGAIVGRTTSVTYSRGTWTDAIRDFPTEGSNIA